MSSHDEFISNQSPMTPKKPTNGIGDYASEKEKNQRYWDVMDKGRRMPPQKLTVVPPDQQGVHPDEIYRIREITKVAKEILTCGTYFVKGPNWIEPPVTAIPLDLMTPANAPAAIVFAIPIFGACGGTTFTVPDRVVGSITEVGVGLVNPAQWDDVAWRITVNGATVYPAFQDSVMPFIQYFVGQIGDMVRPTPLSSPIRIKYGDVVQLEASLVVAGPGAQAFGRLRGFVFPIKETSSDGSFTEYHTI